MIFYTHRAQAASCTTTRQKVVLISEIQQQTQISIDEEREKRTNDTFSLNK